MSSVDTRFFDGYLACAIWADLRDEEGEPQEGFSIFDFAKEARDEARNECADFVDQCGELLNGLDMSQCGHDFWLTRNGHGAGFWDRGLGEIGEKLTTIAKTYSSRTPYVGADEKIHFCEG
jgi:hypothetical protein